VRSWNPTDDPEKEHVQVENVIPVAGNFDSTSGRSLDPKVSRLKASDSNSDGLQIEFSGGRYNEINQKAVIQLQCDKDRTGNEKKRRRDDEEEQGPEPSLTYVSYGPVEGKEKLEVLRLNWRTKYACEDYADSDEAKKSGWGFFTWFVLMYDLLACIQLARLLTLTVDSSALQRILFLAPGSTIIDTELGAGTCYLTEIPFGTFLTSSRICQEKSWIRFPVVGPEADIVLYDQVEVLFGKGFVELIRDRNALRGAGWTGLFFAPPSFFCSHNFVISF